MPKSVLRYVWEVRQKECLRCGLKSGVRLRKDHRHFRSRLHAIVLKHV